jgi:hypothetical protein
MIRQVSVGVALLALCAVGLAMWTGVNITNPRAFVLSGLGAEDTSTVPAPETARASASSPRSPRNAPMKSAATRNTTTTDVDKAPQPVPPGPATDEVTADGLLAALRKCAAERTPVASNTAPVAANLVPWQLTDEIIDRVCTQHRLQRRPADRVPKLFYAVMFGLELDMLEVVLHEVAPVADLVFVTESSVTHSLGHKRLLFDTAKQDRYAQFLPKIRHLVFHPTRQYKSGWDIERRQRNFFLRYLKEANVSTGDIVIGNIDLDEILTRDTLIRMKHCQVPNYEFKLVHYRYDTNCVQEKSFNTYFDTAFAWSPTVMSRGIDLYARRRNRDSKPLLPWGGGGDASESGFATGVNRVLRRGGAWHLTAFGGVKSILKKYENSPHRFVGSLSEADIAKLMAECRYQDTPRFKLPFWGDAQRTTMSDRPWWKEEEPSTSWPPVALPYAVTQRPCEMLNRGWFG